MGWGKASSHWNILGEQQPNKCNVDQLKSGTTLPEKIGFLLASVVIQSLTLSQTLACSMGPFSPLSPAPLPLCPLVTASHPYSKELFLPSHHSRGKVSDELNPSNFYEEKHCQVSWE